MDDKELNEEYFFRSWESLEGFIKDRFTHPLFNVLPEADLRQLKLLTTDYSLILWKQWISPEHFGLQTIGLNGGVKG